MIALFNVMLHPEAYACAYAGEPESGLLERRKYLKSMPRTIAQSAGEAAPGGHHFNRIDTKLARESRLEIYTFLKRYLQP